ncbi:MAG TPA: BACON domain-containing protein [Usitatibacter sp.]|nr:BACON domain-containing protein [Usitatibacter sp.]
MPFLLVRLSAAAVLALSTLFAIPAAVAQSNAAAVQPFSPTSLLPTTFLLPADGPATRIVLAEPVSGAIDAVKRSNGQGIAKRLQIGIGRDLGANAKARSDALQWLPVAGGLAAHWQVTSPGARAMRLRIDASQLPDGAQVRLAGNLAPGTVYGPFGARDLLRAGARWWSPVVEGDTATVEIFVPVERPVEDVSLAVAQISHLFVDPAGPKVDSAAKIGESGTCEVDIACLTSGDPALAQAGKAVARMVFSDAAGTYLCSGTLLNPTGGSLTPYFYGANHCISTQDSADTLTTFWFYDATGCSSGVLNPGYVQLSGGATLLFANATSDGLLLRLNSSPPAGAVYAGWDASPLTAGTALTAIHHPEGDVTKVSLATMGGFGTIGPGSASFIIADWNSIATGVTEGGSSGSGIFTAVGKPASEYRLRGGLWGGPSSCTAAPSSLYDYYSRFDQIYPYLAVYVDPAGTSCTYALSPASASAAAAGASGSIMVTTQPGCAWSTTSTESWISATSSGTGSGTASYSVAANSDSSTRTAVVRIGNQAVTVTQAGEITAGVNVLVNPGFEAGSSPWVQTSTSGLPIITTDASAAHSGSGYAWLGGYTGGTDTLTQDVTIPATASQAQLRFWYLIDTQEATTSAVDTMTVAIANPSTGARLATLATFSNLDDTGGSWVHSPAYDGSAFKGQTVRLVFTATNSASAFTSFLVDDVALTAIAANHTALWWAGTSESGWGLNVDQQGDILFATLFTYDASGNPLWLVASNLARQGTSETFTGALYRTTGPAFNAIPFTPASVTVTQVGTMTIAFAANDTGTLTYTFNGSTVTKAIQKQVYGSRAATCVPTTSDRSSLTNYQDLWWNPSESGWGINLTQQTLNSVETMFATLFTYDAGGNGVWLVMSDGAQQSDGSFLGDLYIVTGASAFNAQPFVPIGSANVRKVGTMRLAFSSGTTGTLSYTFDGVTVTKSIIRQVFSSPVPACAS